MSVTLNAKGTTMSSFLIGKTTGTTIDKTGNISNDTSITFNTNSNSRLVLNQNGSFTIAGSAGTSGQALISSGSSTSPTWGTVPNSGLTNSSLTIGSTNIALGATSTTLSGLTSVSATTFTGALAGNASSATNIAGGSTNQIPFQSASNTTTFDAGLTYNSGSTTLTVGTSGAGAINAASGQSLSISSDISIGFNTNSNSRLVLNQNGSFTIAGSAGTSGQALISNGSSTSPTWGTVPNSGLTNSSLTIGSTNIALGATSTTLAGLTSVSATTFTGALTGAASSNVLKSGDTMTGLLGVSPASGDGLIAVASGSGSIAYYSLYTNSLAGSNLRWRLIRNNVAESGSNVGSDFELRRYDDTGANLGASIGITRSTGLVTLSSLSISGSVVSDMSIAKTNPSININTSASGQSGNIYFQTNSLNRWRLVKDTNTESGSNSGSNFEISSYDDSGVLLASPVSIIRSTGAVTLSGTLSTAGSVGIGTTPSGIITLLVSKNLTGSTAVNGILENGVIQSDVTASAYGIVSGMSTAASSFTLSNLIHFVAGTGNIGSGSTVTSQIGYLVNGGMTGGTNNIGFYGNLSAGTGRWNFYAPTTAQNYFLGATGIGTTPSGSYALEISGNTSHAGNVTLSTTNPSLILNSTATGQSGNIFFQTLTGTRWRLGKDTTAESGSNAGSNFFLNRYDDSGTLIDTPFNIVRSTGIITLGSNLGVGVAPSNSIWGSNYRRVELQGSTGSVVQLDTTQTNADGNMLGAITFANYASGVTSQESADIISYQDGTSATAPGGRIVFLTRSDGGALSERIRITSQGNLGIGSTNLTDSSLHAYKAATGAEAALGHFQNYGGGSAIATVKIGVGTPESQYGVLGAYGTDNSFRIGAVAGVGGYLSFHTGNIGGTNLNSGERMRIDSTGRIGIGGTPSYLFDVTRSGNGVVSRFTDGTGSLYLYMASGVPYIGIDASGNNSISIDTTNGIRDIIGGTEQMRIDPSGNLIVATTINVGKDSSTTTGMINCKAGATSTGHVFANFNRSTVNIGSISQSGTTAVLYNTLSDMRFKDNIVDSPSAINKIKDMKIRSFDWKSTGEHVDYGFVAQELIGVEPMAVAPAIDETGVWQIDPSKLIATLTKALQEAIFRIEALELQIITRHT